MDAFAVQIRRQRTTAGVLCIAAQLIQELANAGTLAGALTAHVAVLQPGSARAASFWCAVLRLLETCPAPRLDQLDDATLAAAVRQGQ